VVIGASALRLESVGALYVIWGCAPGLRVAACLGMWGLPLEGKMSKITTALKRRRGLLIIQGKAPDLAPDALAVREAEHLRGKSASETEAAIKSELNSPAIRVAAIGAAGENRVRFATISNEGRHAGRGGVGAVMGSKNLKAIAVCGDREPRVFDPDGVSVIASLLRRRSLSSLTDKYRNIGTVANLAVFNRLGVLPAHNFQQSTFDDSDALSGETLSETSFARRHGCASCSIRCERLFKSLNGEEQRLEYETLFALGPLCGIKDPDTVLEAAHLCDLYGVDTISTGGTLAWAMECGEKGLLPEAEKFGLCFGRPEGILAAIPAIATRTGLGALLAEGSKRAALELGGDAEHPDLAFTITTDTDTLSKGQKYSRKIRVFNSDYIEANMQRAMHFNFREDLWRYSFGQRRKTGLILEFGVWRGHSSRFFAERLSGDERLYGFDSFEGLQEDWAGNDRPKGYFSLGGRLPKVPRNVTLVKGFFNDSLPGFLKSHGDTPVSFVHFDADTYEAAQTVFSLVGARIVKGTVIVFDEYLGYRGWRIGEWKAWQEFVLENRMKYEYLACSDKQVTVRVL